MPQGCRLHPRVLGMICQYRTITEETARHFVPRDEIHQREALHLLFDPINILIFRNFFIRSMRLKKNSACHVTLRTDEHTLVKILPRAISIRVVVFSRTNT